MHASKHISSACRCEASPTYQGLAMPICSYRLPTQFISVRQLPDEHRFTSNVPFIAAFTSLLLLVRRNAICIAAVGCVPPLLAASIPCGLAAAPPAAPIGSPESVCAAHRPAAKGANRFCACIYQQQHIVRTGSGCATVLACSSVQISPLQVLTVIHAEKKNRAQTDVSRQRTLSYHSGRVWWFFRAADSFARCFVSAGCLSDAQGKDLETFQSECCALQAGLSDVLKTVRSCQIRSARHGTC